jgi:hypothetical protein
MEPRSIRPRGWQRGQPRHPAPEYPHGDVNRYRHGCRCLPCGASNAAYQRDLRARHKEHEPDRVVSAEIARQHLQELHEQGVKRLNVARASGVMKRIVTQIRTGKYRRIRESTERAIMAVTVAARDNGKVVDSTETDWTIEELLRRRFSMVELAARLGYQAGEIPFYKRRRVSLENARRTEQLFRMLERDSSARLPPLPATRRGAWHKDRQQTEAA